MKNTLTSLLCCWAVTSFAQSNFVVERIQLTNTIDKESKSFIPKLKDIANPKNPIVAKVNQHFMDRFEITSYNQRELEEFRWSELDFKSEILDNLLYISTSGEYYAAYPNYVEDEMFFNLSTGDLLKNTDIPFQALFSLKGYFDFMNKHWLPGARPAFKEALECSDSAELYCSYYDVDKYSYQANKSFICTLSNDCYPHALLACAPGHSVTLMDDTIIPFLNDFGKDALITNHYSQLVGVRKYQYNKKIESQIPDNLFFIGKIGGKYEFSMALQLNPSTHKADGYYYYERKKIPITLSGTFGETSIQLEELSEGKITGRMLFTLSDRYAENAFLIYVSPDEGTTYVSGVWESPDKKNKMDITLSEVKTTTELLMH